MVTSGPAPTPTCGQRGVDERVLALYAGGDLDPAAAARLRRHLGSCLACRRVLESYRATGAWLRDHGRAEPDAALLGELQRRLRAQLAERRPAPWLLAWLGRGFGERRGGLHGTLAVMATVSATALLMVGAVGAWLGGRPSRVDMDTGLGARTVIPQVTGPRVEDRLRIEMQTGDPNVRIIWFAASEPPAAGRP
jgi:anti-sigma factor RsiW